MIGEACIVRSHDVYQDYKRFQLQWFKGTTFHMDLSLEEVELMFAL